MKKSHKKFLSIAIFLILIIVTFNFLLTILKKDLSLTNNLDTSDNVKILKYLEELNIKTIEDDISNTQKKLKPKKTNTISNNKKTTSSINYKDVFSSSIIMGDSQSEGLTVYGVLNSTSVIAKKGDNIISAKNNNMKQLSNLSPSNIFILYGMNDILTYQTNIDDFINDYSALIKEIQKTIPESKIFINSILPVEKSVIKDRPIYKEIDNYNLALKDLCTKLNVTYIDAAQILINSPNLFEADGMHLKPLFYNKWLDLLSTYL